MKIYTKVVFSMKTLEVLKEESFEYEGDIALCGGGGGPSGSVNFPDYMEEIHVSWLTGGTVDDPALNIASTVEDAMNVALSPGGNPYGGAVAFQAQLELIKMEDEHASYEAFVDDFVPAHRTSILSPVHADFWEKYVDIVEEVYGDTVIPEVEIVASGIAFRNRQDINRRLNIARYAGGMSDINGVHASTFILGLMNLETEFAKTVSDFEANLRYQVKDTKSKLIVTGVSQMMEMLKMKLSAASDLVSLQNEIVRGIITSNREEKIRALEIEVKESLWDLTTFQFGANLLASINGGVNPVLNQPNQLQSTLGGTARGAAAGAQFGSEGAIVGGGIGALIGFFGSS